jgi:4-hydroxyacetophenone monooxygenase
MAMGRSESHVREELLAASDEVIEDAVVHADLAALRGLVYQLTGDDEVARARLNTDDPATALSGEADDTELLRRKGAEFLKGYRDRGAGEISIGPEERLPTSLRLASTFGLADEDMGLWIEELALDPWARGLEWKTPPPPERLEAFNVVVIGGGLGGLNAAIQLKRAGIPFTLIEKNPDVGGTWWENRYPGCRVDTASRSYTNLFGVDWSYPYSHCPASENERYFQWVTETYRLRDDITFETEVRSLAWDEDTSEWQVSVDGPDGDRVLRANAVITAVGFLNRPKLPDIEGMSDFQGPSFHSARWPHGLGTEGKRFAVIGTGASGYQMIPEIALDAEQVVIFQRTPQWLMPTPGYRTPYPPQVNWLDRNLPFYSNFMRFQAAISIRFLSDFSEIDPDFDHPDACSPANKAMRDGCIAFLERKLGDDPELVRTMTPPHPYLSARPLAVDAEYSVLDALKKDNVTLVTDGIRRITETGIETVSGEHHDVDVIVYATGFHATEYLFPMTIIGRDGVTIEKTWAEAGARAYLGCMVPGFPNLWMVYGPNTNGGMHPASFHEVVARYALECMERLIENDEREVEVTDEAYWRYNHLLDERNANKVWSDPRAHNYYWTEFGRSAVMCPFYPWEIWHFLRHPSFDDELVVR